MNSPITKKERLQYFDLLKGVAIFVVVMGHIITMCIRDIDSAFIFKMISEIHMPMFFFISGYLTYKSSFTRPNIWKRFKQLIIPFFIVSALWIWYFPHSNLLSPISSTLDGLYHSYWKDGYWFTLTLFEIFIVYYPLSIILSKIKNAIVQIIISVGVYIALIILAHFVSFPLENNDLIGAGLLASFFPIFMMGIFAHRYSDTFKTMINSNGWFLIAIVCIIPSWYYLSYSWELPMLPEFTRLIALPLEHFGLIIIALTIIIPWSNKEYSGNAPKPSPVARYFTLLGKESLSIYLLHYFFLFPLTILQEPMRGMGLSFVPLLVVSVIVAFIVIAVTLFVNYIIQRNSTLSFLLIGK
ncbi:MAG: acyltransferase [Muribaculaceae bacterium]